MLIFKTIVYLLWIGVCLYFTYKETGIATTVSIGTLMLMVIALAYTIESRKGMGVSLHSREKPKNKK